MSLRGVCISLKKRNPENGELLGDALLYSDSTFGRAVCLAALRARGFDTEVLVLGEPTVGRSEYVEDAGKVDEALRAGIRAARAAFNAEYKRVERKIQRKQKKEGL